MTAFPRLLAGTSFVVLVLGACGRKSRQPNPRASASESAKAARVAPPPAASLEKTELPLCRVIAVREGKGKGKGKGKEDAGAEARIPVVGTAFEGRDFIDLGNAEVSLRHAMTTREFELVGPGRFLPCFQGTETVLVATGAVKTTAGAGARAGAEVIVATPFGAVHFADAALEARVGRSELDVKVATGGATLSGADPKGSADGGAADLVLGTNERKRVSRAVVTADLVAGCLEAARALRAGPPAPRPGVASARTLLGQWSVAQLRGRQGVRWACAIARAAVGRLDGPEQGRLWAEITASDPVWTAGTLGVDAGK